MTVVGLIPARAGSRRLPNKNLLPLDGRPLIHYTCEAALGSGVFSAVYVNTDSPAIAAAAGDCGVQCPILRPPHLARDDTPTLESNRFLLDYLAGTGKAYDAVMILQPTSPLRTSDDIRAAFDLFVANAPCAVVSASPVAPASWLGYVGKDGRFDRLCGEDVMHRLNGAIYIYQCADYLRDQASLRMLVYPMPVTRGVDIDTLEDLQYAEFLLQRRTVQTDAGA